MASPSAVVAAEVDVEADEPAAGVAAVFAVARRVADSPAEADRVRGCRDLRAAAAVMDLPSVVPAAADRARAAVPVLELAVAADRVLAAELELPAPDDRVSVPVRERALVVPAGLESVADRAGGRPGSARPERALDRALVLAVPERDRVLAREHCLGSVQALRALVQARRVLERAPV